MSDPRDNNSTSSPIPSRPSAFDLQAHLFSSLLQGYTADVSLVVRGSWEAVYRLHRVVLIQAVSNVLNDISMDIALIVILAGLLPLVIPELRICRNEALFPR